jgi:cyanate lyase
MSVYNIKPIVWGKSDFEAVQRVEFLANQAAKHKAMQETMQSKGQKKVYTAEILHKHQELEQLEIEQIKDMQKLQSDPLYMKAKIYWERAEMRWAKMQFKN